MNALQALIQEWVDAEPGRSNRALAKKAGLPSTTIDAIRARDEPKSLPREDTLRALATGLGKPFQVVKNAAVEAIGYRVAEVGADRKHRAWAALVDELTETDEDLLWSIGTEMLRRMKNS